MMRVCLILGLLVTAACAEKKINLEDIERDNLRAEGNAKAENIQTDETKYSVNKPSVNQQQYSHETYPIPSQYNTLGGLPETFLPPQQLQDVKYSQLPPEQFIRPNQYSVHEAQYQQPGPILSQQNAPPLQYYSGYQQQAEVSAKTIAPNVFESQKLNYQPEVVVGNHIQSVQQKAITDKYTKGINKGPVYLDIPMTQLLSYYPQLDINSVVGLKGVELAQQPPLHQLAGDATQQISIPLYTPVYNQKQLVSPVKTGSHQYSTIVPATYTTKAPKGSAYTLPVTSKKLNSPPQLPTVPFYVQPQQPPQQLAQSKKLLYTQAYIAPLQPRYQLIYTQPSVIYSDPTAAYASDFYARVPTYIQDNSLRGQVNQYQLQQQQQQQLYVTPTATAHEAPKEILQEHVSIQDLPQNYVKAPEEPKTHFVPPQLPAQEFKSGITQLDPIPLEDEESLLVKDHPLPPEPKSLLDTYVPSNIIAAQDSARYRERPIQLEGGFLPSKVNFALKKRRHE